MYGKNECFHVNPTNQRNARGALINQAYNILLITALLQDPVDLAISEPRVFYNSVGMQSARINMVKLSIRKKIYFALSNDFLLT